MDYTFNKTLLVILSLSSLLLSSNAVPSTRVNDFISTSVPAAAPKSSFIDNTSTSFPVKIDPEILKICVEGGDKTKHCIETLSKLSEGPFNVVKALEIEVNATLDIAKTLFDTTVKLREHPPDNIYVDCFSACQEMYDSILDSINQTLEMLPRQNFADAYNNMGAVLSYQGTCQDGFDQFQFECPWDANPLIQSTVICVDILAYILENHKV